MAERFTGVLEAALTIFGVVGGPLLALFSLGLFCPWASQRGALPPFILALGVGLWMGFGGPRPPTHRLPGATTCPNATAAPQMDCPAKEVDHR